MTNAAKRTNPNTSTESERLIGWLVSFAKDEKGTAHEIRAGKIFVGAAELPNSRSLVVSESTISSPHLVLNASAKHRLQVQDIFSEHGTFLTRAESDEENKLEGPVDLKHGDWVRIGTNTRFQVCLIDGASK